MTNPLNDALDRTEVAQEAYAKQLGIGPDRIPFTAETLPDPSIAVRANGGLLNDWTSHLYEDPIEFVHEAVYTLISVSQRP